MRSSKRRPSKSGASIDPTLGERLRGLRQARRLTQRQLAGDDFTKGYISLIENGATRVSLRAASIFADRLGVGVADLLQTASRSDRETELRIVQAETLLGSGRAADALALASGIELTASGALAARVKRVRGRALTQTARSREAVRLLDEALRAFRAAGENEAVVRTLYDLALAHARLEQQGEALNLALQCEHMLNESVLVDRTFELKLLSFLAGTFVTLGDFGAADARAERAKALAEDVTDPRAVANLYENLAVTREKQGDLEAALQYARRSLALYEHLGADAEIGSCWNTIGWVFAKRRQFSRAAEALGRAERLAKAQKNGRLMSYVLQNRAELALARGEPEEAARLAQESATSPDSSTRCRALSLLVHAQALARGRATDAGVAAAFAKAIEALEPHGRGMLARAYEAQFEALSARGRAKEANASARRALELLRPALP